MKKYALAALVSVLFSLIPHAVSAQYKFGYLSYDSVYRSMPEYAGVQNSLKELRGKYEAEAVHNEEMFSRMFADFMQGQKDFPLNILLKRQKEMQEAMEKGIAFRKDAQRLLKQAEGEMMKPLEAKLDSAIRAVGMEKGYEYILNTDARAFPFIHSGCGEDVTLQVKTKLSQIKWE